MQLSRLLQNFDYECLHGDLQREVTQVVSHDAHVTPNSLFVALQGTKHDGHECCAQAVLRGATVLVVERKVSAPESVTLLKVKNTHEAYAMLASSWYDVPSQGLAVVGITGTSGKTTITYVLESIAVAAGKRPGVIGTVEHRFAGRKIPASHTTPDAFIFQKLLHDMLEAHVDVVFSEVSSHALSQYRVVGTHFAGALFTNLSPEHLDYHRDLDDYFLAKARLFTELLPQSKVQQRFAVLNLDDAYGKKLQTLSVLPPTTYGFSPQADIRCAALQVSADGVEMEVHGPFGKLFLQSHLVGRFNASNILAAVSVAWNLGYSAKSIQEGVERLGVVPGRFEAVPNEQGLDVFVDYAHKPDALEKVLTTARELTQDRLIVVFGCGGDRDPYKRPLMGEVAGKLADVVVVTSDNPRTENPQNIISSIVAGVVKETHLFDGSTGLIVEGDRRKAIAAALKLTRVGDVLIVAGKGHEDYQIVGTEKRHFDDREEVRKVLSLLSS